MTVDPIKMVKVSVPSLTVPAVLVTVVLRETFCSTGLNVVEALAVAEVVAAALIVRD